MNRVYQFGLLPPLESEAIVREQIKAARDYRNDLVQIERGRRVAVRAMHNTDEVQQAAGIAKAATRSTRRDAVRELWSARRRAEQSAADELARLKTLEGELRRGARSLTSATWGTYQTVEESHNQVRAADLYARDAVTAADPRFARWDGLLSPMRDGSGQIGIHVQNRVLRTEDVVAGEDTFVRMHLEPARIGSGTGRGRKGYAQRGILWLRVGSDGREPVWAKWPILLHRALPHGAEWSWVRVSCRRIGTREHWSCEITLDTGRADWRAKDDSLDGSVALELMWSPLDDGSMRVGMWLNSRGDRGEIVVPARVITGIRKPDSIRGLRDLHLNEFRESFARSLRECGEEVPKFLAEARATCLLWKSPIRYHRLAHAWREARCDAARTAYELLDAWEQRDAHLWDYEASMRRTGLRARKDFYRKLARRWSREYKHVLVPDRNLSREARWGEESEHRFTAAPQDLRDAMWSAFGPDAHDVEWRGPHGVIDDEDEESDPPDWLELAIERWRDGKTAPSARRQKMFNRIADDNGGAWARRKAKNAEKVAGMGAARKGGSKAAE